MIYIPTLTSKLYKGLDKEYENILYSPNSKINKIYKGTNITIWDNYTFYLYKRLMHNKQEIAYKHYLWLMDFIQDNWEPNITLITPDVDWLEKGLEIELLWNKKCSKYPQLYVPNTWKTSIDNLNIIGYALRKNTPNNIYHENWNHCLAHKRDINCNLLTYDATIEIK